MQVVWIEQKLSATSCVCSDRNFEFYIFVGDIFLLVIHSRMDNCKEFFKTKSEFLPHHSHHLSSDV